MLKCSESNEEEDVEILDEEEAKTVKQPIVVAPPAVSPVVPTVNPRVNTVASVPLPPKPIITPENAPKSIIRSIRTDIINTDFLNSEDYLKKAMNQSAQSDRYKYTSIILDRYQRVSSSYIGRQHLFKSFSDMLNGDLQEEFVVSPYTGKSLHPFIWRDFSARPRKLQLLEDIVTFHHLYNKYIILWCLYFNKE